MTSAGMLETGSLRRPPELLKYMYSHHNARFSLRRATVFTHMLQSHTLERITQYVCVMSLSDVWVPESFQTVPKIQVSASISS